jgi:DNA-binding transcriptional MerR regulator
MLNLTLNKRKQLNKPDSTALPAIPDKLYFTIGETAKLCDIKPHVLRYWEEEFECLAPAKRRGNRRFYQRKDVLLVRHIRELLYIQGFTIEGARTQLLSNKGKYAPQHASKVLKQLIKDLENTLEQLEPFPPK